MDPRDDEALWNLLGRQSPPVKASPYFVRRVLREIAFDDGRHGGWWSRVRRVWTLPPRHTAVWSGALALGVLCLSAVLTPVSHPPTVRPADLTTYPRRIFHRRCRRGPGSRLGSSRRPR